MSFAFQHTSTSHTDNTLNRPHIQRRRTSRVITARNKSPSRIISAIGRDEVLAGGRATAANSVGSRAAFPAGGFFCAGKVPRAINHDCSRGTVGDPCLESVSSHQSLVIFFFSVFIFFFFGTGQRGHNSTERDWLVLRLLLQSRHPFVTSTEADWRSLDLSFSKAQKEACNDGREHE